MSRRNKVNGTNQLIHAYTIKNGKFSWLNVKAKEMRNSGGQGKTVVDCCMHGPPRLSHPLKILSRPILVY